MGDKRLSSNLSKFKTRPILYDALTTRIPSTVAESCHTCKLIEAVSFLQGRHKNADGSFGTPFVIEAHFCADCGRPVPRKGQG